jgi:hypothetical protein
LGSAKTKCRWGGADHPLPDEFHPQGGAFGAAGGTEPTLFAGEGDEIFVSADIAPDAREAALGKAAPENQEDFFLRHHEKQSSLFQAILSRLVLAGPSPGLAATRLIGDHGKG